MKRLLNSLLWGSSIALSWVWGLGLFFSIFFTVSFGLKGLFFFIFFNTLGLFLFGIGTSFLSKNNDLESFFGKRLSKHRYIFIFYQLITISLCIFAFLKYVLLPLHLPSENLVIILAALFLLGTSVFIGNFFGIKKIKYLHTITLLVIVFLMVILENQFSFFSSENVFSQNGISEKKEFNGYIFPIVVGFLCGPWLDFQQWQRAIHIQKENASLIWGYLFGSLFFAIIIAFHGFFAAWAFSNGASVFLEKNSDQYTYSHHLIVALLHQSFGLQNDILWVYVAFLFLCLLTTLDSGYIASKHLLKDALSNSKNIMASFLPPFVASPIMLFFVAALLAIAGFFMHFQIEYFMLFYGSFFIVYTIILLGEIFLKKELNHSNAETVFALAIVSLGICGLGYLAHYPLIFGMGAIIPLFSYFLLKPSPTTVTQFIENQENSINYITFTPDQESLTKISIQNNSGEYIDGKWFVYSFKPTYFDTNSVGNVYFGMYAIWVGKTRELFFNHCIPNFDLENTSYYILTRNFEHKYIAESREFDSISVKMKLKEVSRKFVTMEHEVYNTNGNILLGKGKQVLIFVSSKDYSLIDVPSELAIGFKDFV